MENKILIVDDEQEIVELISLYLENENFTVYKFYCYMVEKLLLKVRMK